MRTDTGEQKLRLGTRQMHEAMRLLPSKPIESESKARAALATLRSAVDWLEDTSAMDIAHERLDVAGAWVRSTFGCQVTWSDEHRTYVQDCPVALAHTRIGFSPEFSNVESVCTICGQSPFMCSHITGRTYRAPRLLVGSLCNVCLRSACRKHVTGTMYDVECVHVVTRGSIDGLSLVDRPANPNARIYSMTLSMSQLSAALGVELGPGTPLSCDRCLRPCSGFHDPYRQG